MANANYNAANKGRQWTGAPSDLARYGNDINSAIAGYADAFGLYGDGDAFGGWAPGPGVQFGETQSGTVVFAGNVPEYISPVLFPNGPTSTTSAPGYGTHMHPNARQVSEFMDDNPTSKVYFAPKDTILLEGVKDCMVSQGNLCPGVSGEWGGDFGSFKIGKLGSYDFSPAIPMTSYIYSPANMLNNKVFTYKTGDGNGFKDPCTFNNGFKAPTLDQSKYASLKTYLAEQHWLQNVTGEACSPTWDGMGASHWRSTTNPDGWHWGGCHPALFNHSFRSTPVSVFNDGHVDLLDINSVDKCDNLVAKSNQDRYGSDENLCGLWNRNTPFGDDGYFQQAATDWMDVSPVALTEGGSNGRDICQDVIGN
jgi:hypothetical protein